MSVEQIHDEANVDELGPVDWIVVEFPGSRASVIGPAPVRRTAATVGTAAVVAHGVNRRTDRREDRRNPRGLR